MSDSEDEVVLIKPKFKKKTISRENRRKKTASGSAISDDLDSPSSFSSTKPVSTLKTAKWEKFKGLRELSRENNPIEEISDASGVGVSEQPNPQTHSVTAPLENTAYKTLDMSQTPNLANTFTLKNSHFRDLPEKQMSLETEYADAFGNVSEEEFAQEEVQLEDKVQEFSDIDIDDQMYDSELSVEDMGGPAHKAARFVDVKSRDSILAEVIKKMEVLRVSLAAKERKLNDIKGRLQTWEEKRQGVERQL